MRRYATKAYAVVHPTDDTLIYESDSESDAASYANAYEETYGERPYVFDVQAAIFDAQEAAEHSRIPPY